MDNTSIAYNIEESKHINDKFWSHGLSVLFDPNRILEFFPTTDMNNGEKLNAISRFFLYLSILLFIIYHKYNILFIGIIAMVIIYIINYNDEKNLIKSQEQFEDVIKDELQIKKDTPIKVCENGDVCQLPTPTNPFMNVLISDYTDNPNRPPACAYNDVSSNEQKEKYFNYNLYKDVEDVWEKRNSQREFVTMPGTTIPNDRDSFMKWCWKTTYVCKDGDLNYCLQDEDLRVPGYSGSSMMI